MSKITARISDEPSSDDYAEALECVNFWRQCAQHPLPEDDSSDVMRWLSYEIEATCELIGFASR